MAAFNFYMERQKAGAQNRQPGYILASLRTDARGQANLASNDEDRKAREKAQFIENKINIASEMAATRLGRQLNSGEREAIRRHAIAHSDPQSISSAVSKDADAFSASLETDHQKLLREANLDDSTLNSLLSQFGATIGNLASLKALAEKWRAAQARGMSLADFVASAGRSAPQEYSGNLGSISMSNYTTQGSQFLATGMNYGTFDYLRSHRIGFSGNNILHAGEDAKIQRFSANDRSALVSLAALDKIHPEGRAIRNKVVPALRDDVRANPEMKRLLGELAKASTPEQIAQIQAQIDAQGKLASERSGFNDYAKTVPSEGRDHAERLRIAAIYDELKKISPDPAVRAKLDEMRMQSEMRVGQPQTAEQIQLDNQALRAAAKTPEGLAAAERIIATQEQDRLTAAKTKDDGVKAKTEVAALDAAWGTPVEPIKDPAAKDPAAKDPAAKDPAAKDPAVVKGKNGMAIKP